MSKIQLPIVVTPTRVELATRCHRRHVLSDILSRVSSYNPSLEFGSVIHAGASAHWLGQDVQEAVGLEWQKRFVDKPTSSDKLTMQMALGMLSHYQSTASIAGPFVDEGWRLVDAEQRFEVPFSLPDGEKAIISFQCDRVVENVHTKRLAVVDTKTAGRLDARWEKQWETSLQMKLYKALVKQVFDRPDVDVVIEGVLKHVPSKIQYFVCPDWTERQLAEAVYVAQFVANRDAQTVRLGYQHNVMDPSERTPVLRTKEDVEDIAVQFAIPNYGDCFSYNVECPFRKICTADVDERIGILRGEFFELAEEDETY